jgi:hypothetical protein
MTPTGRILASAPRSYLLWYIAALTEGSLDVVRKLNWVFGTSVSRWHSNIGDCNYPHRQLTRSEIDQQTLNVGVTEAGMGSLGLRGNWTLSSS